MKKVKLTEEQKKYIEENARNKKLKEIADVLQVSYRAVWYHSNKGKEKRNHLFTKQEDDFIRAFYNRMRVEMIAQTLNIPISSVYNRSRKLGVCKFRRKKE